MPLKFLKPKQGKSFCFFCAATGHCRVQYIDGLCLGSVVELVMWLHATNSRQDILFGWTWLSKWREEFGDAMTHGSGISNARVRVVTMYKGINNQYTVTDGPASFGLSSLQWKHHAGRYSDDADGATCPCNNAYHCLQKKVAGDDKTCRCTSTVLPREDATCKVSTGRGWGPGWAQQGALQVGLLCYLCSTRNETLFDFSIEVNTADFHAADAGYIYSCDVFNRDMGIFEGGPTALVLSGRMDLARNHRYEEAGRYGRWSLMQRGPGIPYISPTHYLLLAGRQLPDSLLDAHGLILEIPDYEIQEKLHEVGM